MFIKHCLEMFAACPMPWVLGMCFGRSWRAQCYGRVKKTEVFCQKCCIHMGGTPIAGWFISLKIRSIWCILMYTVYIPRYTKTWGDKTVTILCWSQDGVCVCAMCSAILDGPVVGLGLCEMAEDLLGSNRNGQWRFANESCLWFANASSL